MNIFAQTTPHILCVSWDRPLAATRELLLTTHGYKVTSAIGLEESKVLCSTKADLLLLGHSVPRLEKQHILECFRRFNDAPALSLVAPGQTKLPDVDFAANTFQPEELMKTIREIVGG